ncbi:hypothetical protein GEV33_002462 [Tenebrio molitor]|uniref:Uncharacterized protein n=1 Tax=Tenebrio molitor TaxID=7067 RepID=A0A8J6LET9_TENMO|nr:hypothetical protein GEV33_002462 [Tenebrio molitor]
MSFCYWGEPPQILVQGLASDELSRLTEKYKRPTNCEQLEPPEINEMVAQVMSGGNKNRDQTLCSSQKQLTTALSALGQAITRMLDITHQSCSTELKESMLQFLGESGSARSVGGRRDATKGKPRNRMQPKSPRRGVTVIDINAASYIPTGANLQADRESRTLLPDTEWSLSDNMFRQIVSHFGRPEIDLFASQHNFKCKTYFSWLRDPRATGVDAFTADWGSWYTRRAVLAVTTVVSAFGKINQGPDNLRAFYRPVIFSFQLSTPASVSEHAFRSGRDCIWQAFYRRGTPEPAINTLIGSLSKNTVKQYSTTLPSLPMQIKLSGLNRMNSGTPGERECTRRGEGGGVTV